MNIHEYQAKEIFAKWGLPVLQNQVCSSLEEVETAYAKIAKDGRAVLKCQIHAGGRGKSGGVKLVSSLDEAREFTLKFLGRSLVTFQTNQNGQPVNKILVEECRAYDRELYVGVVIDRSRERMVFIASTEGGTEIEKVARETPEKIFKTVIDPMNGPQPYQGRALAYKLGLTPEQSKLFVNLFIKMCRMYEACDCSLLEVNPLVVTADSQLICLDAKMNIDNNALYRQKEILALRDVSQEPQIEAAAQNYNLNYVALDGNIGCMVNGAGLAMATMDIIKLYGGNPANFLDVGGSATKERVVKAFELILSEPNVKAIFVNIFGGIVRCDLIAEGIKSAISEVGISIPVVVRLEGNGAEIASKMLADSKLNIIAQNDLALAAQAAVKAIQ
ncbi:MAG: ADP-forming succinate--CoA ligase subunit beta [Succinivibrionaceae bacterium]|nr:ADP-forming succinate--CoA ligase subunit beta [Succinivibrionaceae bacterium]